MIYTTYFAKLKSLPSSITPVSICGWPPKFYTGLQYKNLAPLWSFFSEWKRTHDNDYYIRCFKSLVLSKLNQKEVVDCLHSMAGTEDIALVCYEKPGDFCHRHLVADWLNEAGYQCEEYKYD